MDKQAETKITALTGPVERRDGNLVLLIPLAAGGTELINCSCGIGEVEGEYLKIVLRDWLAEKLGISEGSKVHVSNEGGKFNIQPVDEPSSSKPN
ncbi:MAG TPA: hypothetical protein VJN21_07900 [Candidatus Acidoferrales bacterium]|nr:hypothetical protein [Candidatus Acidoferrales bacterium]